MNGRTVKQAIACALLGLAAGLCAAQDDEHGPGFGVRRVPLGSGTPQAGQMGGTQLARLVADGDYHVPNYMPGYPTAATIWPREVEVECVRDVSTGGLVCDGYHVHPSLGRGEYIYMQPVVRHEPAPHAPEPASPKKPRG
jgi:hypothetical protein